MCYENAFYLLKRDGQQIYQNKELHKSYTNNHAIKVEHANGEIQNLRAQNISYFKLLTCPELCQLHCKLLY